MRTRTILRKNRPSMMLPFAGLILIAYLIITVVAGIGIALLIYYGVLQIGIDDIDIGPFILSLLIGNLIIGSVTTVVLSHFLLKPLNRVLNAMSQLASGDFSARLSFRSIFRGNTTVKELTNSFNTMAAELEQTEMLSSDFINNFSHEFKTPIVSIAGFAKLLKRGNLTPEEQLEYLDVIEQESLRLSQMATNVLNLTRVENQTILTDVQLLNVSEQIRTCVLALEGKWTQKKIEFSLPIEEFYVNGNDDLLKLVWINLFDNAIKFSPEYGVIETSISNGDAVRVTISNYGDTIPEDQLQQIFRKFYQADQSHASEGNGIGLAIVKKVVELHGGEVSVQSQDGKTSFRVTLPRTLQ